MTHPDADLRGAAFATVFVLAQHLDRLGDAVLEPLGLTTKQWLLLAVVERGFGGRAPTLSEAAALYGSSRQNVKAIARGLESRGYLRLVADPADRRATRLEVTGRTAEFSRPGWRTRERTFFDRVFGALEPAEVGRLAHLLSTWLAALAPSPASGGQRRSDPGAASPPSVQMHGGSS